MSSEESNTRNVRILERDLLVDALQRRGGSATRQELNQEGFSPRSIAESLAKRTIVRSARGLYRLAGITAFGESAFANAALLFPEGVITLVSALAHYGFTTQIPTTIDMAVPRRYSREATDLSIRQIIMPAKLLSDGVNRVRSNGYRYRIFSRERSICDAFRYTRYVSEQVAYESLGAYLRQADRDIKALVRASEITDTGAIIIPVIKTLQAG